MKKQKKELGITLVALVVTIIILLILAGVTLSIALSENGIFNKAKESVEKYKVSETNEQEQLTGIEEQLEYAIRPISIEDAKNSNYEFGETTTLPDEKGNKVVIPGKFHIAKESGETVQDGIVIEDSDGNQFVWIPVSNTDGDNDVKTTQNNGDLIIKNDGSKVEITLGRYIFNETNGETELKQKGSEYPQEVLVETSYKEIETSQHENGGVGAKNLEKFVESVKDNHGYYLGRYEASFGSGSSPSESYESNGEVKTSIMTDQKPAVKVSTMNSTESMNYNNGTLWNFITQEDASKVSRNMYRKNEDAEANYVESDLVNSYAWDTAVVYIQSMGHTNYANKNGETNTILKNTGDTGDKVCNIFDMSGNILEWTTEYSTITYDSRERPCVSRGGSYTDSFYTAHRWYHTTGSNHYLGFRPLLYLK